jgi:hypothetical protein
LETFCRDCARLVMVVYLHGYECVVSGWQQDLCSMMWRSVMVCVV